MAHRSPLAAGLVALLAIAGAAPVPAQTEPVQPTVEVTATLAALFDASLLEPGSAGAPGWTLPDEAPTEASLSLLVTNRGVPLELADRVKFYIYPAGKKREDHVAWGHAARTARFPAGTYDVVVRYEHDAVEQEIVHEGVELAGDHVARAAFDITEATLTVEVTNGGRPIQPYSGAWVVWRHGRGGQELARKRPGETLILRPGSYDIEVSFRDSRGLTTKLLENTRVDGSRIESVEIGVPLAHMSVTLTSGGRSLAPDEGYWRVYEPGQRRAWLAERGSGELLGIERGTYDIGVFSERPEGKIERWLLGVRLDGERHERVELGAQVEVVTVEVTRGGSPVPEAWCSFYPPGRHETAVASASSGGEARIEPGSYDVGCFLRDGGERIDRWIENRAIAGGERVAVELSTPPAFLRVLSRDTGFGSRGDAAARLLVLIDGSVAMRARVADRTRLETVQPALAEVLRGLEGANLEVGLRAIGAGAGGPDDCAESRLLVPPVGFAGDALAEALDGLRPSGRAPLAYALEQAAQDLPAAEGNSIVVVTGSSDGCGGDPCAAAARLMRQGPVERIAVIGFGVDRDEMRHLDCVGQYYAADSVGELKSSLREVVRAAQRHGEGTLAVFAAGENGAWVAGGLLGEKIKLSEGIYDIVIRDRGKLYEWPGVRVSGNLEAVAGRRPPRTD